MPEAAPFSLEETVPDTAEPIPLDKAFAASVTADDPAAALLAVALV
jgi:hypothetical protein